MNIPRKAIPIVIVLFCIITRLPQLLSPELFLDSDECVVALMTKHLLQGKELPLFFWGQAYGFSLIEELFILPFMAMLGVSVLAVKLGMLTLWSLGVVLFYYALLAVDNNNKRFALLLTLLLIAMPAWALWSMKARGGYISAFALSSLTILVLYSNKYRGKAATYVVAGTLIWLVYESQLFWLTGLLPFVAYRLWQDKKLSSLLMLPVMAGWWALFKLYKQGLFIYYKVEPMHLTFDILADHVKRIPFYLFSSMHGTYYLEHEYTPNIASSILAAIGTGVVFLLLVHALALLIVRPRGSALFVTATLFIPAILALSLFTQYMQFRYLLPVTGYAIMAIYILYKDKITDRLLRVQVMVLIVAGTIGLVSFDHTQCLRTNKAGLQEAVNVLRYNKIKYVYCADELMQWDIMFLTDEKVLARTYRFPGRYPKYDTLVDRAYYRGEKTAAFGYRFGLNFGPLDYYGIYHLTFNPPREALQRTFKMLPSSAAQSK